MRKKFGMRKSEFGERDFGASFGVPTSDFRIPNLTILAAFALAAIGPASARAQSSYPMLMSLKPIAVQIGATTEHEVSARYNLYGASQVMVVGGGVTAEVVPPEMPPAAPQPEPKPGEAVPPPKKPELPKIKLRFTVAADAVPGPRSFRVITAQGASTVGQLVLVRDPVVYEADKNDTLAEAQAVTLPATLSGAIEKAEDVDFFKFTAAANQAITFHVESQRCENKIHDLQVHSDPILTIRNSNGTVLALNDNYFYGDPLLHYRFAAAGEYALEIRDARYQGNVDWQYSIEAHDRPFVTNISPARITPGVATRVTLVGFNLPADPTALVTLPPDAPEDLDWMNVPLAGGATVAAPVIVSRLPEAVESAADNDLVAQAQPIGVPSGVSGVISQDGDIDCYSFDAKKDEVISFEVVARRRQSSLDSIMRLLNAQGGVLLEIDDMNTGRHSYADSQFENWKVPADGKYVVEVRDLHQRGGPDFTYFLKVTKSQPYFVLDLDSDKTLLAPGAGAAIFVRAYRRNGFAGDIQLAVEGLPPGVTAQCGKILAAATDGCIVLQAAADAPHGASNLKITGTSSMPTADASQPPVQLAAVAEPLQEIYMPGGGRFHFPVEMHTVSVGDVMDLKSVKLSTNAVALKPGQSQKIDITIERAEGFKGNVTLDCVMQHLGSIFGNSLPPGVTLDDKNSQTLLSGEQSQGHITLVAAADAKPVENQLVPVMANVSINFVMKYAYSSEPLKVTVQAP